MKNHAQLLKKWRDCRADLEAAQNALPPLAEVESHLRETLEYAVESWEEFCARLAAELATGDGRTTLRDLTGGVDLHPKLPLAGAIAAHGVERLLKAARAQAEATASVRLDADARAEAVALLSRERYGLEVEIAAQHFEAGEALPEGIAAAALLGLPLEVAEGAGLIRWGA